MNSYKIVYSYYVNGETMEVEMIVTGLELPDALAYVVSLAVALRMTDFRVLNVYSGTEDGDAWDAVPDWADHMEYDYQKEKDNE